MAATLEAKPPAPPRRDRLYTGKDLLRHPEWGPCELIRGKVVPVCRPNIVHGTLMSEITTALNIFVKAGKLGRVVSGDSGVYLERNPDTVCGPDVYFVSAERRALKEAQQGYLEIAPELCVEIVSPKDRWVKLSRKVELYLEIGVKLVWVIDPSSKKATIYRGDKTVEVLGINGELSGEQVLPGFTLPLKDLFAVLD